MTFLIACRYHACNLDALIQNPTEFLSAKAELQKRKNETTAYDDDNDADHDDPNHQVESTLVKAFAQSARDKRRVMIIDVGANNGQWFKQMLKLTALITTDYGTFRLDCHRLPPDGPLHQVCGPKGCSSSCFVRRRAASRRPTCSSRRRSSFPR